MEGTSSETSLLSVRDRSLMKIPSKLFVIWLDDQIKDFTVEHADALSQLSQVTNKLKLFIDRHQCFDFLTDVEHDDIYLVISQDLSQDIIPVIHDFYQIKGIFIFGTVKKIPEDWLKVKGIHTNVSTICSFIKKLPNESEQDCVSFSLLDTGDDLSEKQLDKLDPMFMYSQILTEILLEINFKEKDFVGFIEFCRQAARNNDVQLKRIDEFEKEYHEETAIKWYTSELFLYTTLNDGLRIVDPDTVVHMAYYIVDLYRQIVRMHDEQYPKDTNHEHFKLYRGQVIPKDQFEKISKTQGGLIAFNNFLSTSTKRNVAEMFADAGGADPQSVGILFVIIGDPSKSSAAFASIKDISQHPHEEEVLFVMHAVFRIGKIARMPEYPRSYEIELILTDETDKDLKILRDHIQNNIPSLFKGWYRLVDVLSEMGLFNKVEELLEELLKETNDEIMKAMLYHNLGKNYEAQGKYELSIEYLEKSLDIQEQLTPLNVNGLLISYSNLAAVYKTTGSYLKAHLLHQQVLAIREKIPVSNHLSLANSHENIGLVYSSLHNYSDALREHEKALEIRQRVLPSNHFDIARSLIHIGSEYYHMANCSDARGSYEEALKSHTEALQILERSLPSSHIHLALCHSRIGAVYTSMGRYSEGIASHESARDIRNKSSLVDHPDEAAYYTNMGPIYYQKKEYLTALSCFEEALKIRQKLSSPNGPDLAQAYYNVGLMHFTMKDYSNAVQYDEKALATQQPLSPEIHMRLAHSYIKLGQRCFESCDCDKSLSYYQKALGILLKTQPPNHSHLAVCYNDIGAIYFDKGDYDQAFSFLQKALAIQERTLSPDNFNVLNTRVNIFKIYHHKKDYIKARAFLVQTIESVQGLIPFNHPIMQELEQYLSISFLFA